MATNKTSLIETVINFINRVTFCILHLMRRLLRPVITAVAAGKKTITEQFLKEKKVFLERKSFRLNRVSDLWKKKDHGCVDIRNM